MAPEAESRRGLLVALGLISHAVMPSAMVASAISVHWRNGLFVISNGIELPLLFGVGAAQLTGPAGIRSRSCWS